MTAYQVEWSTGPTCWYRVAFTSKRGLISEQTFAQAHFFCILFVHLHSQKLINNNFDTYIINSIQFLYQMNSRLCLNRMRTELNG